MGRGLGFSRETDDRAMGSPMKVKHSIRLTLGVGVALLAWPGWVPLGRSQAPLTQFLVPEPRTASGTTNSGGAAQPPAASGKLIEERLSKARADLAVALTLEDVNATNRPAGISLQDIVLRRALLERL